MKQNKNATYFILTLMLLLFFPFGLKGQMLMSQRNGIRDSLQALVDEYWQKKEYDKSINELFKIIDLYKDVNGGNSVYHMKANINAGIYLKALERYDEAVEYFEKAYLIWKKMVGIPDDDFLYMARECASCYGHIGDYDGAIRWGSIVVEQEKRVMADVTDEYVDDLCKLGMFYYYNNNFSQAKDYLAMTISGYRKLGQLNKNNLNVMMNAMLIAKCFYELEDFDTSEELYLLVDSALTDFEKYKKYRILTCNMLGVIASKKNDNELAWQRFDDAERLYNEYSDSLNEQESEIIVNILSSKASLFMYDDPKVSSEIYDELAQYYESEGKTDAQMYAICLSNQACCYILMNNPKKALDVINKAFASIDRNKYAGQQLYLDLLSTKMLCLIAFNDARLIEKGAAEMTSYIEQQLYDNFPLLTEPERATYWLKVSGWYSRLLPTMTLTSPTDRMAELCYNGILQSKGILLNSTVNIDRILKNSDSEMLLSLQRQRQDCKDRLQRAIKADDKYDIDYQSHLVTQLEKRILKEVASIGNFMDDLGINVDIIKANLGEGELAIEFLRSTNIDDTDTIYLALTIMRDYEYPHIIRLFNNDVIKRFVGLSVLDADNSEIYARIWQPIIEDCDADKLRKIYFAADGLLYNIPIEYCKEPGGKTIIEEYECYRVSSTRFLAKRKHEKSVMGTVALYGDIDYNAGIDDIAQSNMALQSELNIQRQETENYLAMRDVNLFSERGAIGFDMLYGTREEIDAIASIFNSHKIHPLVFDSYKASKESVDMLSETDLRILHFATHGFYINKNDKQRFGYFDFVMREGGNYEQESMSRSALVMAGANKYIQGTWQNEENDNVGGFLTAYDISLLDLHSLDMAVLSACESGLGDIDSEGVFGLQRGFKKAGTKSLLMSLVKVNDHATMLFMKEFYNSYLSGRRTKRESLIDAQKYLRNVEDGRWNRPEYWASFILLDGM